MNREGLNWWYCSECGDLRCTQPDSDREIDREPPICEINGAGCEMIPVAKPVVDYINDLSQANVVLRGDVGTKLAIRRRSVRVSDYELGRTESYEARGHVIGPRWFFKQFGADRWRRTTYGDSLRQLAERVRQYEREDEQSG